MDEDAITNAQGFLTVDYGDNQHQLVDLEMVLHRHTPANVLSFLETLVSDLDRHLRRHIKQDKTDSRINEIVARRFRVKMALRTLKNSMAKKAA